MIFLLKEIIRKNRGIIYIGYNVNFIENLWHHENIKLKADKVFVSIIGITKKLFSICYFLLFKDNNKPSSH